ncbi:MAG: acyltransferase 3 [Acidimicrobiales bacterium]|nr:acyltransferase 3 [Acidimicrobiales bacterium]
MAGGTADVTSDDTSDVTSDDAGRTSPPGVPVPSEPREPPRVDRRLPQLDGLRAVLVGLVMAHHMLWASPTYARGWAPGGWVAIDGFFVLSGFLICGLLLNEHDARGNVSYFRFLGRRLLRLYPAMAVMLLATTIVAVRYNSSPFADLWPTLRSAGTYSLNWPMGQNHALATEYTHTWSLGVEFQFYAVFPLVVMALYAVRARPALWLGAFGALIVAATAARQAAWHGERSFPGPYVFTHTRMDSLLWGAIAALLIHWGWLADRKAARLVLRVVGPAALVFLVWVVANKSSRDGWTYRWGLVGTGLAALAVVLWLSLDPRSPLARLLARRPMVYLGQRSYSAYLWHYPAFFYVTRHLQHLTARERVAAAVAITLVLSDLSYRLVERPTFALKDRWLPRRGRDAVPFVVPSTTATPAS